MICPGLLVGEKNGYLDHHQAAFFYYYYLNEKFEVLCSHILVLCSTMTLVHFFSSETYHLEKINLLILKKIIIFHMVLNRECKALNESVNVLIRKSCC